MQKSLKRQRSEESSLYEDDEVGAVKGIEEITPEKLEEDNNKLLETFRKYKNKLTQGEHNKKVMEEDVRQKNSIIGCLLRSWFCLEIDIIIILAKLGDVSCLNSIDLEMNLQDYMNFTNGYINDNSDVNMKAIPPLFHFLLVTSTHTSLCDLVPLSEVNRIARDMKLTNSITNTVLHDTANLLTSRFEYTKHLIHTVCERLKSKEALSSDIYLTNTLLASRSEKLVAKLQAMHPSLVTLANSIENKAEALCDNKRELHRLRRSLDKCKMEYNFPGSDPPPKLKIGFNVMMDGGGGDKDKEIKKEEEEEEKAKELLVLSAHTITELKEDIAFEKERKNNRMKEKVEIDAELEKYKNKNHKFSEMEGLLRFSPTFSKQEKKFIETQVKSNGGDAAIRLLHTKLYDTGIKYQQLKDHFADSLSKLKSFYDSDSKADEARLAELKASLSELKDSYADSQQGKWKQTAEALAEANLLRSKMSAYREECKTYENAKEIIKEKDKKMIEYVNGYHQIEAMIKEKEKELLRMKGKEISFLSSLPLNETQKIIIQFVDNASNRRKDEVMKVRADIEKLLSACEKEIKMYKRELDEVEDDESLREQLSSLDTAFTDILYKHVDALDSIFEKDRTLFNLITAAYKCKKCEELLREQSKALEKKIILLDNLNNLSTEKENKMIERANLYDEQHRVFEQQVNLLKEKCLHIKAHTESPEAHDSSNNIAHVNERLQETCTELCKTQTTINATRYEISREEETLSKFFLDSNRELGEIEKQVQESKDTGTMAKEAEQMKMELKNLRKKLCCSICNEKYKDTILSKCGHMFCESCLNKNLASNNRKCPTCRKTYNSDDMGKIFLSS